MIDRHAMLVPFALAALAATTVACVPPDNPDTGHRSCGDVDTSVGRDTSPDGSESDGSSAPDADAGADTGAGTDTDVGTEPLVQVADYCRDRADVRIDVYLPRDTGPTGFRPSSVSVSEGDVVRFKNMSFGSHTILDGGPGKRGGRYFTEYISGGEDTFCLEFGELPASAGGSVDLDYFCSQHDGERGTITVQAQ